jgi:hypothetical protein
MSDLCPPGYEGMFCMSTFPVHDEKLTKSRIIRYIQPSQFPSRPKHLCCHHREDRKHMARIHLLVSPFPRLQMDWF